jgi:endonuclease/exonuclease/phosphatase (EEP) superfamily protein YafD
MEHELRPTGATRAPRARALGSVLVAAAVVHPLAIALARWSRLADLIAHFQGAALGVTLLALVGQFRRNRLVSVLLAILALIQVDPLFRYDGSNPVPPDPRSTGRLRVLMANVFEDNRDFEALARLVREEEPDIIGLVEFSHAWVEGMERVGLHREYPFFFEYPNGARGLALFFRRPPRFVGVPERLVPEGNPILEAGVDFDGRPLRIWLVHAPNPLGPRGWRVGDADLSALSDRVGRARGSRLVIGDLNRTAGSPHLADFLAATGLRDSRLGFGMQASWPTWSPYRIAIDHAFVSPDLAVVERRLGPDIGSDHRPVILELAPAATVVETRSSAQASQSSP